MAFAAILMTLMSGLWLGASANAPPVPAPANSITPLLQAYFHTQEERHREGLAAGIAKEAGGDWDVVANQLGGLDLWSAKPVPGGTFVVGGGTAAACVVECRLPDQYDPRIAYPVLVTFQGAMPYSFEERLGFLEEHLNTKLDDFIIVAPKTSPGRFSHHSQDEPDRFRPFLRALRRDLHVDCDRVYLFGSGYGADLAWMNAIHHSDVFAGAILVRGYPPVPYAREVYPFLLENLTGVPILFGVPESPGGSSDGRPRRGYDLRLHLDLIHQAAERQGLPFIRVSRAAESPDGAWFSAEQVDSILDQRRAPPAGPVSHWFRYPEHGNAGWLRQTKFAGEVWEDEQISILPGPGVDRGAYITEVIQSKLAYLGSRIEGQDIHIQTRKCGEIDILLGTDFLDFTKPITIHCNGRRRGARTYKPDIGTMLEEAYRSWDFQRLVAVRIPLSIREDAELSDIAEPAP